MQNAAGEIAFSRDMLAGAPEVAGLAAARERRQLLAGQSLARHSRKRYGHHYKANGWVMVTKHDPAKGQERLHGPCPAAQARPSATARARRGSEGCLEEAFSIRKLQHCKDPPAGQISMNDREDATSLFAQQPNELASCAMSCSS